ncbi:hypothetical protein HWV62_21302 [Athelia sp. TMB]|nr:hypothetical protein HWV62_21302 [Athelia sp. TMB]
MAHAAFGFVVSILEGLDSSKVVFTLQREARYHCFLLGICRILNQNSATGRWEECGQAYSPLCARNACITEFIITASGKEENGLTAVPTRDCLLERDALEHVTRTATHKACGLEDALPAPQVLSRELRPEHALKDIVKVIQAEEYQYTDPLTRFLHYLYVDFDFEAAQNELSAAERVVEGDFFLGEFASDWVESARGLVSEVDVRIHQRIDIGDLSKRLNLDSEEGGAWIVNLILETRMGADAKIDLEKNVIEINRSPLPVYQSVIEKTRGLAFRSQAMGAAMARPPPSLQQQAPATVREERAE